MMTPSLETERLILRKPAPQDWDAFRDFAVAGGLEMVSGPATEGQAWRIFAAELGHWDIRGYGMWAMTLKGDDTAIGLVGPWHPVDWPDTEIGWQVYGNAEGKGYAYEAALAARTHAQTVLGWTRIVSYIDAKNSRSIRLAERLGAVLDPQAKQPNDDKPCLVYVHPAPEALQ